MDSFIPQVGPWLWWIIGALLLIGELLMPGVFLLWLAVAAGLTAIVDMVVGLDWKGEIATFAILSVLLVLASWKYVRAQHRPMSDQPNLNQRHLDYVGRRVTLLHPIHNGLGKVRIDDSVWDVEGPELAAGAMVVVTGVKGTRLSVEAAV
jgi:inner membrane protein